MLRPRETAALEYRGKELTTSHCHTFMYDMPTTLTSREFIRNFSRLKKAAANGEEVVVRDRQGKSFIFQAQGCGPSLAEQLRDLCGALNTGKSVKNLRGFGRNRE
jgi:hypothetical protein